MAETLSVKFTGNVSANLQETLALSQTSDNFQLPFSESLTNGTGALQADRLYGDTRVVSAGGTDTVSLYDFDGTQDSLGEDLVMLRVKMLVIQNLNGTESNSLSVGPAASQGWTPFFGASRITVLGGSTVALIAPGAAGYPVTPGSIENISVISNGSVISYNLAVIGAHA